jgi:hypothetical protein
MDESIAQKLGRWLGRSDGVSLKTKRALIEHGELEPAAAPPAAPAVAPVGGPSPSAELLERVRLQQEARSRESLRLLMEKRQQGR